jgi:hypothetical protein
MVNITQIDLDAEAQCTLKNLRANLQPKNAELQLQE